ncbi:hypothetical protein DWW90_12370 [Parabacteroides sp. AF17-28]|uniref:DUF6383 domain-containing protein n=1 Tax=Parabacteroides sp. AF17-28 TaxID=2292241 RepID=UPI000EFF6EAC|nr:DUF6383 domain-containing protein [Parabacteroides sp. AF17-28]RHR56939.1 hypothetical protein DWW90_12370 [Parabacteroides sp. AF17-28]
MNKKFFTLAAAFGLAASSFTTAQAAAQVKGPQGIDKAGVSVLLGVTTSSFDGSTPTFTGTTGLEVDGATLKLGTAMTTPDYADVKPAMWTVSAIKTTSTGSKLYSFINNTTGTPLSVNRKVAIEAGSTAAVSSKAVAVELSDKNAITEWAWDETTGQLYTYNAALDSTYTLAKDGTTIALFRAKGSAISVHSDNQLALTDGFTAEQRATALKFTLKASDLGTAAFQLYFNGGKDATAKNKQGEKNPLTAHKFTAVANGSYLSFKSDKAQTKGKKADGSEEMKDWYLAVDTNKFEGGGFMLMLDTLKDNSSVTTGGTKKAVGYYQFKAEYYAGQDSLVLTTTGEPQKAQSGSSENYFDGDVVTPAALNTTPAQVQLTTLTNVTVLNLASTITAPGTGKEALIQFSKNGNPAVDADAFIFPAADLKKVYFVQDAKVAKQDGTVKTGWSYILDNAKLNDKIVANVKGDKALPYTQWVMKKEIAGGTYTLMNREAADVTISGAFYKVAGKENVYAVDGDTIKLVDAEIAAKGGHQYDGFKHISAGDLKNMSYAFASASTLTADKFLAMKKDSTVALMDNEQRFRFEVDVNEVAYGAMVEGVDTLYREEYKVKSLDGNYVAQNIKNDVVTLASPVADEIYVISGLMKAIGTDSTYVFYGTHDGALVPAGQIMINAQTGLATIGEPTISSTFYIVPEEAPEYKMIADKPTHREFHKAGDEGFMLANVDGFLAERQLTDLKASLDDPAAFRMAIDTAYVNRENNVQPLYLIGQDVTFAATAADTTKGLFLVSMKDSAAVDAAHKEMYSYNDMPRLGFVAASHIGDSLIIERPNATDADTLQSAKNKAFESLVAMPATFSFKVSKENKSEYSIVAADGNLAILNGVAVLSDGEGQMFTESAPTANEAAPSVSEVKVIATNGAIQVIGAQGKKVVVSNILGQTIANTVIASDNATIAAPQGVVVVAIEGEEAVKAIVK